MRIYLLRHCQSEANAGASRKIDCGLTELGRRQIAPAAAALAEGGLSCILSSPYRRCLAMAKIIRGGTWCGSTGCRRWRSKPFLAG